MLRRSVSLGGLVLYGLGTTIGAGIYALIGVVAGRAGMHAPVAFAAAAVLALFTALSFAELSSRFPRAGGEAVYVEEGLRIPWLTSAVGLLIALAGLISAATVTVAFAGYLSELAAVPPAPTALVLILAVGAVSAWGVRESVAVVAVMTVVETAGLVLVIGAGAPQLVELPARLAEIVPLDVSAGRAVAASAVLAFYAFLGFEDMVNVAEEVHDVERTLPRAILLTLAATAALYVLVASVAVLAVPPAELAASDAPLSLVFERCGGPPTAIGVIALFALLNGVLIQVVKASRVLYGLAREGRLPARLGDVHPWTRTPLLATAISTAVAAALALSLPLETLAESTSVVTLFTFGLANGALVMVKRRDPRPGPGMRVPSWVPVMGFATSAALLVVAAHHHVAG